MKTNMRIHLIVSFSLLFMISLSVRSVGQTSLSVLPVNTGPVAGSLINNQQWLTVSQQMQDHFVNQLATIGTVRKISREHGLLLLKEMPSPDPENLNAEAYKVISKKEQIQYLLKSSIESAQAVDKNIISTLRIIIVDGSSGKVFWEKVLKINKVVSNPVLSEHILLNEVYKLAINDVSKEIKVLKY